MSYYSAGSTGITLNKSLRDAIAFTDHNLTMDQSFRTMQMVVCRNVLIYFNKELQNRVMRLFDQSLQHNGILWLGTKETLDFSDIRDRYRVVSEECRIYQKIARGDE